MGFDIHLFCISLAFDFEVFLAEVYQFFELDIADNTDDHTFGRVAGGHEGFELLGGEMADVPLAAQDVVG